MSQAKILSFVPFGIYLVHNQLDAVVGLAARLRGAEFAMVRCNGIYKYCDVVVHDGDKAEHNCKVCAAAGDQFFTPFQVPTFQLRDCLQPEDWSLAEQWVDSLAPEDYPSAELNGIPFGRWTNSSISSSFRITSDGFSDPKVQEVHRQYLINGVNTYRALERIISQYQPTAMLVFNGRYAPYRIALEMAKERNIPVVTHERGYAEDTFFLFENHGSIETAPTFNYYDIWKDVALTRPQLERMKQYYINREGGKDLNFTPFMNYQTEYVGVRHKLRIPEDKKVLTVFTSSEYEVGYCDDLKTELTQLEVVKKLIDIFRDRDDILVVRHHPYIAGNASSLPDRLFLTEILKLSEILPPNVKFIFPTEQLSSYALFWNVQAGISFFSSTGLEGVSRGLPMASFLPGRFRDGLPYHITDFTDEGLSQLVDTLLSPASELTVEDLRRLYRFHYSVIGRLSVSFRSFGIKNHFDHDIRFKDAEKLAPGQDPTLDRLLGFLMEGSPLLPEPAESDRSISAEEETAFLQAELDSIFDQRKEIPHLTKTFREGKVDPLISIVPLSVNNQTFQSWLTRSRFQNVKVLRSPEENVTGIRSFLSELLSIIENEAEEFLLFVDPRVSFTEAFLSQGIDMFALEENAQAKGLLSGVWLMNDRQEIASGAFYPRHPCASVAELKEHDSRLLDIPLLLSLVLFRKQGVVQLITSLLEVGNSDEAICFALVEALLGEEFGSTKSQFAIVRF